MLSSDQLAALRAAVDRAYPARLTTDRQKYAECQQALGAIENTFSLPVTVLEWEPTTATFPLTKGEGYSDTVLGVLEDGTVLAVYMYKPTDKSAGVWYNALSHKRLGRPPRLWCDWPRFDNDAELTQ